MRIFSVPTWDPRKKHHENVVDVPKTKPVWYSPLIISSAMENLKTQITKTEMFPQTILFRVKWKDWVSEWVSEWWPLFSGKRSFHRVLVLPYLWNRCRALCTKTRPLTSPYLCFFCLIIWGRALLVVGTREMERAVCVRIAATFNPPNPMVLQICTNTKRKRFLKTISQLYRVMSLTFLLVLVMTSFLRPGSRAFPFSSLRCWFQVNILLLL